jgi:hypothetical protein
VIGEKINKECDIGYSTHFSRCNPDRSDPTVSILSTYTLRSVDGARSMHIGAAYHMYIRKIYTYIIYIVYDEIVICVSKVYTVLHRSEPPGSINIRDADR